MAVGNDRSCDLSHTSARREGRKRHFVMAITVWHPQRYRPLRCNGQHAGGESLLLPARILREVLGAPSTNLVAQHAPLLAAVTSRSTAHLQPTRTRYIRL